MSRVVGKAGAAAAGQLLQKSASSASRWFLKSLTNNSKFKRSNPCPAPAPPVPASTWLQSNFVLRFRPGPSPSTNKISNSSQFFLSSSSNLQLIRGLRNAGSGGNGTGKTTKTSFAKSASKNRQFLLTALQDSGSRMSDRAEFLRPIAFTAFVAGSAFVGSAIWQYENYKDSIGGRFSVGSLLGRRSAEQNATTADKIFWPICIINGVVFLAWRIPALTPAMVTYFTATPISRAVCLPMVLSTFSHFSFYHLAANMFVLHSFLPAATSLLGPEKFVGMYLTAGVVSSLGSHIHKILIGSNIPSLGASGAIMGILAFVCTRMPDIELGIIFLPGVSFSASTAIKCILAVDTVGLLAGWKFMDHAAHLSGAVFGIGYSYFEESLEPVRNSILKAWHNLRSGR